MFETGGMGESRQPAGTPCFRVKAATVIVGWFALPGGIRSILRWRRPKSAPAGKPRPDRCCARAAAASPAQHPQAKQQSTGDASAIDSWVSATAEATKQTYQPAS